MIKDKSGSLYGTTEGGGGHCYGGCGTVFKIARDGSETVLHAFRGGNNDGDKPIGGLTIGNEGNIYGTTQVGGTFEGGTIFEVKHGETVKTIYSFQNASTGIEPFGGVTLDRSGNIFGTTVLGGNGQGCNNGGYGCGVVFKLSPDGTESVLYAFQGYSDGSEPNGGVILDVSGNLYGTTEAGGANNLGTVFKVTPDGAETVLHSFEGGGSDGAFPESTLVADQSGNLYGTTPRGGSCDCGTVFRVSPDGTETVVYAFRGGNDGYFPTAGLARDKAGDLFGVTGYGGGTGCQGLGCGTVFRIAPDGSETVLYGFEKKYGILPFAPLLLDRQGELFGTASAGGKHHSGTIFELTQ